jgi:hypothetical protein
MDAREISCRHLPARFFQTALQKPEFFRGEMKKANEGYLTHENLVKEKFKIL